MTKRMLLLLLMIGCSRPDYLYHPQTIEQAKQGARASTYPVLEVIGTISSTDEDASFSIRDDHGIVTHFTRCVWQRGHFDVWKGEHIRAYLQFGTQDGDYCVLILSSQDLSGNH